MVNCLNKIMSKINSKFLTILYLIIYLFDIIKSEILECQKDSPFRKYNQCTSEPCLKVELDSNNCYINNTIIKNQWLNNIITFGELTFRYINIASYYNGDMVVETTSCPEMNKRIFFGLKQNGRPFFNNKINMEETLYYSNDIINKENDNTIGQYESIGIIVRHNDTKGEYYLSLPKLYDNAELFDFSNDNIYYKPILRFASFVEVHSLRHSFFPLTNRNNPYDSYYLFCFVGQYSGQSTESIFIQKHIFKYEGEFKKNLKDGKGIYYFVDGGRYEGEFRDDKKEGRGTYYSNKEPYKGDKYIGEFKNNLREGKGIYYFHNGDRYEGDFRNNMKEGKGVFYFNNGDRMMGDYYNNLPKGKFVKLTRFGEVQEINY